MCGPSPATALMWAPPSAPIAPKTTSLASAAGGAGDLLGRRRSPPPPPPLHRFDRRRGRHGVGIVDVEADAERRVARAEARHRHRRRQRIDPVGAGDHAEQQLEVLDVAAHRPDAAEVEHAGRPGRGPEAGLGDAPGGGTDADAAAVVAGQPDRAAAVDADPDQRGVGAHQRRLAAARPTRRPRVVVRVVGAAEEGVVGLGVGGALGDVGLGDDDRARLAQPPHDRAVARGDPVARRDDARGRRPALDVDRVLDRHREAEEGSARSARARRVAPPRRRPARGPPRPPRPATAPGRSRSPRSAPRSPLRSAAGSARPARAS